MQLHHKNGNGSDGWLTAALTVGRPDDLTPARRWIATHSTPNPKPLTDPSTDLADLQ